MNSHINLFRVKVRSDLITGLIQDRESFRGGKRGLIQARVFPRNGCLIGERARQFDLRKAKANSFILMDKNQCAQIRSAYQRQYKQRFRFFPQKAAQHGQVRFSIDSIRREHAQRLLQPAENRCIWQTLRKCGICFW